MKRITSSLVPVATLVLLLATACSNTGGETTDFTAARLCAEACVRVHGCDSFVARDRCESDCVDVHGASFPKVRDEVIARARQCFATKSCPAVLEDAFVGRCIEEGTVNDAPSAEGERWCSTWRTWADACGASFDNTSCLTGSKRFRQDALASGSDCFSQACDRALSCLKQALGSLTPFEPVVEAPTMPGQLPSSGSGSGYNCTGGECRCSGSNLTCCRARTSCTSHAPDCDSICKS